MYIAPLVVVGPFEGVIVAAPATTTTIAPYGVVSYQKASITLAIPLTQLLEGEE